VTVIALRLRGVGYATHRLHFFLFFISFFFIIYHYLFIYYFYYFISKAKRVSRRAGLSAIAEFLGCIRGGGACILVSGKPPIPREQCFSAYQFWATHIFMPTPQNDQIRLGNTYGEGRVLHQSVAPFVSDS